MRLDIVTRRKARGLTQKELADLSGVSVAAINFFENNLKTPSLQVAYNIAYALQCKIDDLICD